MTDTPPPKKNGPGGKRLANPQLNAVRAAEAAIRMHALAPDAERADKCFAIADSLIQLIGEGHFTLTTALDAARLAKLLHEIGRIDSGQPTSISGTAPVMTTAEQRAAKFAELTQKANAIETTAKEAP